MSSIIEVVVLDEHGEVMTTANLTVAYGNETQKVVVILSDPDTEWVDMTAREVLNECMAEQLAMTEGYDA